MNTSVNTNNIEINNGMSQVINILTGETKKIRCHYISSRTDKPVSRVLTLERLSHPALTAAGVTAWAERFNDGVNSFDWLRVSIQLTDKICYTPNCANVGLPDVENYGNLDYYMGQEGAMRVYMNNVDKFFQSIADKPAKMMTGEDWPNMAVIAAYRAAGRDEEADTLTTARDIYEARREAKNEAWQKEWEEKKRKEQEKQNSFAEGMRIKVPAASLERNRDKEAFVITRIRRKAADNGGNASLTVKSELTGMERDINGSDVSEILPALQQASEITDTQTAQDFADALEIKTGDRVLSKHYGAMATVLGREWDNQRKAWYYRVEFDTPQQGMDGTERKVTEFRREGITKNYYPQGTAEIVGNAIYYAEELQAGFWGTDSTPRTIFDCEIFKPTDRRPSWLLVADVFSQPQEMTLQQVAEYLARRYQEANPR